MPSTRPPTMCVTTLRRVHPDPPSVHIQQAGRHRFTRCSGAGTGNHRVCMCGGRVDSQPVQGCQLVVSNAADGGAAGCCHGAAQCRCHTVLCGLDIDSTAHSTSRNDSSRSGHEARGQSCVPGCVCQVPAAGIRGFDVSSRVQPQCAQRRCRRPWPKSMRRLWRA